MEQGLVLQFVVCFQLAVYLSLGHVVAALAAFADLVRDAWSNEIPSGVVACLPRVLVRRLQRDSPDPVFWLEFCLPPVERERGRLKHNDADHHVSESLPPYDYSLPSAGKYAEDIHIRDRAPHDVDSGIFRTPHSNAMSRLSTTLVESSTLFATLFPSTSLVA